MAGIAQSVKSLVSDFKELLKSLFIPSDGFFDDYLEPLTAVKDTFVGYYDFLVGVKDTIINSMSKDFDPPSLELDLWGDKVVCIDWALISPFRVYVHSFIIAIVYFRFFWWCLKNLGSVVYHE